MTRSNLNAAMIATFSAMTLMASSGAYAVAVAGLPGDYTDAQPGSGGNTVNASGGSIDDFLADTTAGPSDPYTPAWSATDGLWDHNTNNDGNPGFNPAGVLAAASGPLGATGTTGMLYSNETANSPTVRTTAATALDSSVLYNVYVVYHSSPGAVGGGNHGVSAAITGQSLVDYDNTNGIDSGIDLINPSTQLDTTGNVFYALLGQVTGVTSVSIDVQHQGAAAYAQTFYDGVLVEVVPEPASVLLMGMGGLMMLRRRR
jgi:hypothetical protein